MSTIIEVTYIPPGAKMVISDNEFGQAVVRFMAADAPTPQVAIPAPGNRSEIPVEQSAAETPVEIIETPAERPVVRERLNIEFFKQVILERGGETIETALLPMTEWHAAAVIAASGRSGVTYTELIEKVPGWTIEDIPARNGKPEQPSTTNNAVDVAVSKIGKRLREARIPYQISREEREEKTENGRFLRKIFLFFERLNL